MSRRHSLRHSFDHCGTVCLFALEMAATTYRRTIPTRSGLRSRVGLLRRKGGATTMQRSRRTSLSPKTMWPRPSLQAGSSEGALPTLLDRARGRISRKRSVPTSSLISASGRPITTCTPESSTVSSTHSRQTNRPRALPLWILAAPMANADLLFRRDWPLTETAPDATCGGLSCYRSLDRITFSNHLGRCLRAYSGRPQSDGEANSIETITQDFEIKKVHADCIKQWRRRKHVQGVV